MKPLAKLVIRKLREYKKSCRDQDETFLDFNEVTSLSGSIIQTQHTYLFSTLIVQTYFLKVVAQGKTGYN